MMSSFFLEVYFINNLNNLLLIIIVPEKPHWGGSIKYVCMYVLIETS